MKNFIFLVVLAIDANFEISGDKVDLETDATVGSGGEKTDLDPDLPNTEIGTDDAVQDTQDRPKHAWYCGECDASKLLPQANGHFPPSCGDVSVELSGDDTDYTRPPKCTGKQLCEMISKTDPNELPPRLESASDSLLLDGNKYAPGWLVDINIHRYCCDHHQLCGHRMSKAAIAHKCENPDYLIETDRRTCCKLEGLACNRELVGKDLEGILGSSWFGCKQDLPCVLDSRLCCLVANMSCSSPMCHVGEEVGDEEDGWIVQDPCEATEPIKTKQGVDMGLCLQPSMYGQCCEFHNRCNGYRCPGF